MILSVLLACPPRLHADALDGTCFESFTKPFRVINVAASEAGRVATVDVRRGDTVAAGQQLLQLDSAILKATRDVVAAQAAGTARIDGMKVEHNLQVNRLKQFESLAKEGLGSSEELHRARADEQIALANLREAQEQQEQQRLKIVEIDVRLAARRVTSPIAGIVVDVKKEPGEFVSSADPEVAIVVDLARLRASFFLPTELADAYNESMPVRILLIESDMVVAGTIEHVSAITEAHSGSVRLDVVIENPAQELRSGVRCRLLTTPDVAGTQRSQNAPSSLTGGSD
jgi:RND family efflux transporter MFP subunit